jgi:Zn-dependent protease with chaperone function
MPYLLCPFLCAVIAWLCNYLELAGWRKSAGLHWTERARQLHPARTARLLNVFLIATIAMALLEPDHNGGWDAALLAVLGIVGAAFGGFPMERMIHPDITLGKWLRQIAGTSVLFVGNQIIFLVAIFSMPSTPGWEMAIVACTYLVLHFSIEFGSALALLRIFGLVRPASPRLQAIVARTSADLGVPVRATWEAISTSANAMALEHIGELLFTERLLEGFTDDEVRDICAHELGHLAEPVRTRLWRAAGSLALFPLIFLAPIFKQWSLPGVIGVVGIFLLILFLRNRHSRIMEKSADRTAREVEVTAAAYARTLEHLHHLNWRPAVLTKKPSGTHPDLYDRMLASGLTPDYPRPAPPRPAWTVRLMGAALFAVMFMIAWAGIVGEPDQRRETAVRYYAPTAARVCRQMRGNRIASPFDFRFQDSALRSPWFTPSPFSLPRC